MKKINIILKMICTILVSIISLLCFVSGGLHVSCNPFKDNSYQVTVQTCFAYIVELFGRGSQVVVKDSKYIGFGQYVDEYYLDKPELGEIEILKDKSKKPSNIIEFVELKYFSNNISSRKKNKIEEKAKTRFYQTGLNGLFTTNNMLENEKPWNILLEKTTNYYGESEFDYGSLLFSLKHSIRLNEINDHIKQWNNVPYAPVLLTDSLVIKTGDEESAPCAFLKVADRYGQFTINTETGYENLFMEKLQYLRDHNGIVQELLEMEIFIGFSIDICKICEFIEENGIEIIGYLAIDSPESADCLTSAVEFREKDLISKLVEVNNSRSLFR